MTHHARRLLRYLLFAGVIFVALSWYFAYKLTGPRQRSVGAAPADMKFAVENVTFATEDRHTLAGWYLPAEGADSAVVLLHGYGGDRRQMMARARLLREQGHAVLLYDARACGESEGQCISFGCHEREDLLAALAYVKARGSHRTACLGVSQGGATILMAAERMPGEVRCVVCESAFDQFEHALDNRFRRFTLLPAYCGGCLMIPIGERRLGVSIHDIRPVDHIGKLACPILVISGEDDTKTTSEDTRRLYEAAREPKELWMITGAGHRDLFDQDGYWDRVTGFLKTHLGPAKAMGTQ